MPVDETCMRHTVKNTSGVRQRFSFLAPHGVELDADEEYTVTGPLFINTYGRHNQNARHRAAAEAALLRGDLQITTSEAIVMFDGIDRSLQLTLVEGSLDTAPACGQAGDVRTAWEFDARRPGDFLELVEYDEGYVYEVGVSDGDTIYRWGAALSVANNGWTDPVKPVAIQGIIKGPEYVEDGPSSLPSVQFDGVASVAVHAAEQTIDGIGDIGSEDFIDFDTLSEADGWIVHLLVSRLGLAASDAEDSVIMAAGDMSVGEFEWMLATRDDDEENGTLVFKYRPESSESVSESSSEAVPPPELLEVEVGPFAADAAIIFTVAHRADLGFQVFANGTLLLDTEGAAYYLRGPTGVSLVFGSGGLGGHQSMDVGAMRVDDSYATGATARNQALELATAWGITLGSFTV